MGTLVREPYPSALDALLRGSLSKELFHEWRDPTAHDRFERGELSEREYFRNFYRNDLSAELRGLLPSPRRVKKYLFRRLSLLGGMGELLRELQSLRGSHGLQIGLASNYSEWYELILESLPILGESEFLFFSCEMGLRKPEEAYYERISRALLPGRHGVGSVSSPRDIFFLDDRMPNVQAALRAGWQAHLMTNSYDARRAILGFLDA